MLRPLAELAAIHYGKSPAAVLTEESEIPVVGTGGTYCLASRPLFPGPAIVVPRKGSLGNPSYLGQPFWASDTTYAVIANRGVDTRWLYYSLASFDLSKLNEATGVPSISRDWLRKIEFHVPAQPEQERIAEILSMLDSAIQQTQTLVAKLRHVKSGLMHDLFTRGLASNGTLRGPVGDKRHHHFQPTLGWIPKDWAAMPVRNFGSVTLGRQRSPDKHSGLWTTPYLRVANVFDGFIDYSDVLEMDFTPAERNVFSLRCGDILLNEGQSLELVGRSALFEGEADRFCFQNTLVRFRVNSGNSEQFFSHLFKWFLDRGVFARIAKQTTSVAHLGADRFARLICIAVPPKEQRAIEERLNESQRLIGCEEKRLTKLQHQRQGLMRDLLLGRVSVAELGI